MNLWKTWKNAFDQWELAISPVMEAWMKSPLLLAPAGSALSMTMRVKALSDKMAASWWGAIGLPTKRDQERTLHALNELESRLLDLEEQLADRS